MQRWNGWGDESVRMDLVPAACELLRERVGEGRAPLDCSLEKLLEQVPKSLLGSHALVTVDPKSRLDHGHGQSLPDWIRLRSGTLKRFPDGVALPTSVEQLDDLLRYAEERQAAIIPFGGGTSVVGHLEVPETERPVLSVSLARLNRLIRLQPECRLATFEAGIRGPSLEEQLGSRGFTLGHFPQSFEYSTLGGWVVTRSTGQQSSHYGRIERLFRGGEVVTPRGVMQIPPFPASAAGPDLRQLILGSEGRFGILSEVTVEIARQPETDEFYGFFFPNWSSAREAVRDLATSGVAFSMVRLSNAEETRTHLAMADRAQDVALLGRYLRLRGISEASACLCLVGFTGSKRQVRVARHESFSILRRQKGLAVGKAVGRAWKKHRFRSAYLRNTLWEQGYGVDTMETAVTWDKVTDTMEAIEETLRKGLSEWNERVHVFSHLSSIYPTGSSIYTTVVFRLAESPEDNLERWRALKGAASRVIVEAGGTISHQHGVGVDHKQYLTAEKGAIGVEVMKRAFSASDPDERLNPGKLLPGNDDVGS